MTRALKPLGVALALAALAAWAAPAWAEDVNGPRCADVVGGGASYATNGTLRVFVELLAPPCRAVEYTLTVFDEESTSTPLAATTGTWPSPFGDTRVDFTVAAVDDDGTVCTVVTTTIGRHLFDRAPDEGCIDVRAGTPPARNYT